MHDLIEGYFCKRLHGSAAGCESVDGVAEGREQSVTASLEDVAARARVSTATVSRALRGLPNVADSTRQRVDGGGA